MGQGGDGDGRGSVCTTREYKLLLTCGAQSSTALAAVTLPQSVSKCIAPTAMPFPSYPSARRTARRPTSTRRDSGFTAKAPTRGPANGRRSMASS